jgi:hypothetical protein
MLSFRGLRLVLTRAASRRVPPLRPKTKDRASRSSGPLDASETGENRVSRRDPHFGDPLVRARGIDSSACSTVRPTSDIPVASFVRLLVDRAAIDASVRRPPRSVPRGPRERRALLRPEMPSIVRSCSATARAEARTDRVTFVEMRRSRDEDCRASNEPSPLRLVWPSALARFRFPALARWAVPLVARLPSTRLLLRPSFRLVRYRGRASLSPKTTYRLLQYDDARAPTAGRRILDRDEWRRSYSPTFALCRPLRADASDEPRDPHASEDARAPWTGRPE